MKITKRQLSEIIRKEVKKSLNEIIRPPAHGAAQGRYSNQQAQARRDRAASQSNNSPQVNLGMINQIIDQMSMEKYGVTHDKLTDVQLGDIVSTWLGTGK